ncbi:helix-turn-helix transcriptional regulator [Fibrella forsythiae]|uniref:Helix-turn-helix transcriptional regulator n=1 Tax=Fibrella forsythiae TaxID=2817061 RepID=A0ABS3JS87_9BACT|nr:helix-turn-helix transcriptional regulator [Fibrella forsythiae]MBO0952879.1 helix-turn-helix transcriptional regulator [Fibrella forsythiae]
MKTSYQEFKPSLALQPFVECYWLHHFETQGLAESPVQRCLPFGALELILHLDDNPAYALFDNCWQKLPQAFFVGLYRSTVHWKAVGTGRKFGIRLKPESLLQLFNVPVASLFNNFTDLESFFGRDMNRLMDNVHGLVDMQLVINEVEQFLFNRVQHLKAERNYLVAATQLIRQAKGNVSIEGLSAHLSISKRQLERSFKDTYGTSPKMYQRIIRFRNAYESFQQTSATPNWLDVSYNFGYSDQAHFIRDFKEFSNEVPTLVYQDAEQYFRLPNKGLFTRRA